MKASQILSTVGLAAVSLGQTPPGFTPSVETKLEVIFGTKAVSTPGDSFTIAGKVDGFNSSTTSTYLHTVIRDFAPAAEADANGVYPLTTQQTGPVTWFGPMPPAENPPRAHRYTNLIWEQPDGTGWTIPQSASSMLQTQRFGFNVASFQTAAALEDPISAVWFNVTG
ncbi:hypothetical protein SLS62_010985 [Diatrype stigma]|uniref:PEBP-like protein n=1 Tax=Diatrype stigma TaxID=117547 RepID=A0AAN9U8D0_9PEZI